MNFSKLPAPDAFGNFWFGTPGDPDQPAIMEVRTVKSLEGRFFVSLGRRGVLFDGGTFMTFASPALALKEIRRRLT